MACQLPRDKPRNFDIPRLNVVHGSVPKDVLFKKDKQKPIVITDNTTILKKQLNSKQIFVIMILGTFNVSVTLQSKKMKGGRYLMKTKTFIIKVLKLIAIILLLSTLLVLAIKK